MSSLAFCTTCGQSLQESPPPTQLPLPHRDERKTVTVLHVDLVGFTAQAELLDPEDVRATQNAYFAAVRRELVRFGGVVEKFMGDAVMACFGAPTAHEDDPERAVRAAFAIQAALRELNRSRPGPPLHVRIGVATGEAVISRDGGSGQGMVSGDVVTVAARLQQGAPVDGILVAGHTHRATRPHFEYAQQQSLTVPGRSAPVPAWLATGITQRTTATDFGDTPLIGRDSEIALLTSTFQRAVRENAPQLVTVVAPPGIGKSRLVWELSRYTDTLPDLLVWRQGRCLPYGDGVTYWALAEIVKAQAGILETDSREVATERLQRAVSGLGLNGDSPWLAEQLAPLVGLAPAPEQPAERAEGFAAWRRFLVGLTAERPAVLVFEDLHWADDGLLDFIDELVDGAAGAPLLVVATTRPELLERRLSWGGGKRNALTISLSPLTEAETAALFAELLGQAVLPADIQQTLLALAGGNPLYAEEYVRMLVDRGVLRRDGSVWAFEAGVDLPLPQSVQAIIAARLDGLDPDEKAVLLDASVMGPTFWLSALQQLSGLSRDRVEEVVRRLERRELLRSERFSSVEGEEEFAFRHVLVRDVAYSQLPRALRAERHRRAASWLDGLASGRSVDQAEMLAHHWLSSLELDAVGSEAPAHKDAARRALRAAAERAYSLSALGAALAFSTHALALWPADLDPIERWRLVTMQEGARFLHREDDFYAADGAARLRAASAALIALNEPAEAARAETLLGQVEWYRANRDAGFAHLTRAAALLAGEPTSERKAVAYGELARLHMFAHHHTEAIDAATTALAMADELGLREVQAELMVTLGTAHYLSGQAAAGVEALEQAVDHCRQHGLRALHRAANNLAVMLQEEGELRRSYALIEESEAAGRAAGLSLTAKFTEGDLAVRAYWEGDWRKTLRIASTFLDRLNPNAPHPWECHLRGLRGMLRVLSDKPAQDDLDRAVLLAEQGKDPQLRRPALATVALASLVLGKRDVAEDLVDRLLADWRPEPHTASREWLPVHAEVVSQLADERLDETIGLLRGLARPTLWTRAALAFCEAADAWRRRELSAAGATYAEAAGIYARIGDVSHQAVGEMLAGVAFQLDQRPDLAEPLLASAGRFFRANQATWVLRAAFPAEAAADAMADPGDPA